MGFLPRRAVVMEWKQPKRERLCVLQAANLEDGVTEVPQNPEDSIRCHQVPYGVAEFGIFLAGLVPALV